ncbi:hypothetical protein [Pontibacter sp. G13]|uniref:hypothetical protein n=1 Tax=Pontibacter sp. G13 TaxID=3074898 RepID=UPI002889D836|nr:hypothetical protein [Pontibacter sp. G13]WNJ18194.1 hypothetical protein RJD25_25365 [Pontibacter sp. G13]
MNNKYLTTRSKLGKWLFLGIAALGTTACNNDLKQQNLQLTQQVEALNAEMDTLRRENAAYRQMLGEQITYGFEVQIGAFEDFDLGRYEDHLLQFSQLEAGNMNKFVLGRFEDIETAQAFLNDIRNLGIQDAFIAGIVDGQRTTVEEAKAAVKDHYGF